MTALNGEEIAVVPNPPGLIPNPPGPNDTVSNILVDDGLVDIEADNGVIHGVDGVLAPASLTLNIVDIVAGDDRFSTLVGAVTSAGLADALTGEGPLTLFGKHVGSSELRSAFVVFPLSARSALRALPQRTPHTPSPDLAVSNSPNGRGIRQH